MGGLMKGIGGAQAGGGMARDLGAAAKDQAAAAAAAAGDRGGGGMSGPAEGQGDARQRAEDVRRTFTSEHGARVSRKLIADFGFIQGTALAPGSCDRTAFNLGQQYVVLSIPRQLGIGEDRFAAVAAADFSPLDIDLERRMSDDAE